MWHSFEIKASEDALDQALPHLVAPFSDRSDRSSCDRFFFMRPENNRSTLHVSLSDSDQQFLMDRFEYASRLSGVRIKPAPAWRPEIPSSPKARLLIERFAEHSSRQSLYLLTKPKAERIARMCFFDALLAYHFLRSETAVRHFFHEHAQMAQRLTDSREIKLEQEIQARIFAPLRALFHFVRTRKKPLASRLAEWNRVCRETADGFLVMSLEEECLFADETEPGTSMKRMLRYLIREHQARLFFSDSARVAIARGIACT